MAGELELCLAGRLVAPSLLTRSGRTKPKPASRNLYELFVVETVIGGGVKYVVAKYAILLLPGYKVSDLIHELKGALSSADRTYATATDLLTEFGQAPPTRTAVSAVPFVTVEAALKVLNREAIINDKTVAFSWDEGGSATCEWVGSESDNGPTSLACDDSEFARRRAALLAELE